MTDDWNTVMDEARAFCDEHHVEWHELCGVVVAARVAESPREWEGQGIGSSDRNHMVYAAAKCGELPSLCADLVERGKLLEQVAAVTGERNPKQVLAELREFFAPVQ